MVAANVARSRKQVELSQDDAKGMRHRGDTIQCEIRSFKNIAMDTHRRHDMRTSYRQFICFRVFKFLATHIQKVLPSLGNCFEAGSSVMIYEHLGNDKSSAQDQRIVSP